MRKSRTKDVGGITPEGGEVRAEISLISWEALSRKKKSKLKDGADTRKLKDIYGHVRVHRQESEW